MIATLARRRGRRGRRGGGRGWTLGYHFTYGSLKQQNNKTTT